MPLPEMKATCLTALIGLTLLASCTQRAKDDSERAAGSAANSLESMSKTIKSVSKTAGEVQRISNRIRNIRGVEMSRDHDRWEYKVVSLTDEDAVTEDDLNDYGKEGWELTTRQGDSLIFKRRKVLIVSDKNKNKPSERENK